MVFNVSNENMVLSGKYIIQKNNICGWVYDVSINYNNKIIAVIGFSEKQIEGALFRQVSFEEFKEYDEKKIKKLSKDYFTKNK